MQFDRKIFFDSVRPSLFGGKLSQGQVDGMNFKLDVWCHAPYSDDLRHPAYCFATSYHETGQRMEPVREGFKETDAEARAYVKAQGYDYAAVDPVTGQVYYGRGDIQTTWADNYKKTSSRLGLSGSLDLYLYPEEILDDSISAAALFMGMWEGWYRSDSKGRQTLKRYFSSSVDDAYGAREIVNGDKSKIPSWSNGVSIGNLIKGYHLKFLTALQAAYLDEPLPPEPEPEPEPTPEPLPVLVALTIPEGVQVLVTINGEEARGLPQRKL